MGLWETIISLFSYQFMVRALMIGLLISLCAALLGVSLVLKRYSMIGDGLSHVGFGALAVATALNWTPLAVSLPVVLLAAFLLLRLSDNSRLRSDAAIGLISASSLALGVMAISLRGGVNTDLENYLFGSILATTQTDLIIGVVVCLFVLATFIILYPRIFAVTFDQDFASASGLNGKLINALIAGLTALVIVLGMRLMGALLISSLIIFPTLSALWLARSFKGVTRMAAILAVVCFLLGLVVSFVAGTPTGATIVVSNLLAFLVCYLTSKLKQAVNARQNSPGTSTSQD
jgi:zinc transport system permease protein